MKLDRKTLENDLISIISNYNRDKNVELNVKKAIKKHGIEVSEVTKIWKSPDLIGEASEALLYLIVKYLHEETGEIEIDKYFTKAEIKDGDNYKFEKDDNRLSFPLVFPNTTQIRHDQFVTPVDTQLIARLLEDVTTYNFETQRNPKFEKDKDGELIKRPRLNPNSVKEIKNSIKNNDFIGNTLTLNLFQNGEEEFNYDINSKTLTLFSGQLNPIDGYHRASAAVQAVMEAEMENISLKTMWELRITTWDIERCRQFIVQEDKRNKINKVYLQSKNIDNKGVQVISKLNEMKGEMKERIATDKKEIQFNKAYTMFDIMSNTVNMLWELNTPIDVYNVSNYLRDFFDWVIGFYIDVFNDGGLTSRSKNVITYPITFIGYLTLAKYLQNQENWREQIKELLNKIDFSLANPDWENIGVVNRATKSYETTLQNKTRYQKVIDYFQKLV